MEESACNSPATMVPFRPETLRPYFSIFLPSYLLPLTKSANFAASYPLVRLFLGFCFEGNDQFSIRESWFLARVEVLFESPLLIAGIGCSIVNATGVTNNSVRKCRINAAVQSRIGIVHFLLKFSASDRVSVRDSNILFDFFRVFQ